MKLIVAGSRKFTDYNLLRNVLDKHLSKLPPPEIVSGGAKGTDSLGERYASERGLKLNIFDADWDRDGRKAGPIRNEAMCKYATDAIFFWDGMSAGTGNCIKLAKKYKLNILEVVKIEV